MKGESGECAVCKTPAKQRCGACHETFYCGREHQKTDWARGHKTQCHKRDDIYEICEDDVLGRYLIASRDIQQGELIIREAPIIEAPSQFTQPVCVLCFESLTQTTARACEKCGWPACVNCWGRLQNSAHDAECTITFEAGRKINITVFGQHHPNYQSLAPLRSLYLKFSNHEGWKRFISLQSHCEQRKKSQSYEESHKIVKNFILNYLKLKDKDHIEDEILKVCGILQVNGHEVPSSDPPHVAVYNKTSLLQHSCVANCSRRYVPMASDLCLLEIRAMKFIAKGQNLSISYTDPLWSTFSRRMQLQETKYFSCTCERCSDPRELGTMMSAVRCFVTPRCLGFALPVSPLEQSSDWQCDACKVSIPHEKGTRGYLLCVVEKL